MVPDLATALRLVSQKPLWPQLGAPSPHPLDRPLLHQGLELGRLMTLTGREDQTHRFALPFDPQMQLGAQTTLTFA